MTNCSQGHGDACWLRNRVQRAGARRAARWKAKGMTDQRGRKEKGRLDGSRAVHAASGKDGNVCGDLKGTGLCC